MFRACFPSWKCGPLIICYSVLTFHSFVEYSISCFSLSLSISLTMCFFLRLLSLSLSVFSRSDRIRNETNIITIISVDSVRERVLLLFTCLDIGNIGVVVGVVVSVTCCSSYCCCFVLTLPVKKGGTYIKVTTLSATISFTFNI